MSPARPFVLATLVCALAVAVQAVQEPSPLPDVLARVGRYVDGYERSFSAIVSREHYVQRMRRGNEIDTRELRSEVALVPVGDALEWILFRDVYEVDGRKLRGQKERLAALFGGTDTNAAALARKIADESSRYNLGSIERTINTPTIALMFLRSAHQPRSSFDIVGEQRIDGIPALELRFRENALPRIIVTHDNAAADGRVWVYPATGRVARTRLQLSSAGAEAAIDVHYADDETLGLLVPVRMTETYSLGQRTAGSGAIDPFDRMRGAPVKLLIDGRATYSDYRRFSVETKTIIK
jgi:hypothetical protein